MAAAAMKHMASSFAKLEKFKGVDFRGWQKKMHFMLSSISVMYVLTTPMPEDGGENPNVEQVRKRAKWDNDDYVYRGLILNGMSDSLFDIYQNVDTFKELWDTLEAKYMAEDASSKKLLVSNFTNYKMTDSRRVLEHYNELLGILGRFTQHKMNMDVLGFYILDFKHTLKHLKEELTLVELGRHLRIEESLRAQDNDKPKANNVVGPSVVNMVEHNNSSRYNDHKGKRKHHDTRANPNKKPKVTCWNCRKPGHLKKDCKGSHVGNKANGSSTKGPEDGFSNSLKGQSMFNKSHQIYYVTYVSETFFVQDDDVVWWVDSGATVHVCKDRCWFKTYESLNDGSILHMGNESIALVHGCGCVDLSVLNNCGYKEVTESNKIVLSKHGVFIGFGYLSNHMFRHNIVSIGSAFMSTSKLNDSILWHARLSHVHLKRMQDMSKDGLIPTIDMDTEKCKTCMLTKITKKPFRNVKRKTKVLELIHSDFCDMHATPSIGNEKYFVTFIDDASRAAVRLPDPKLKTLGERGIECIFVGYAEHSKAYRFYVIEPNESVDINSIIESRDVIFDEHKFSSVPKPSQRSLGFNQTSGINYFDTYALVARISTIRLLIALASIHNLIIHQMDVKTAFLNEDLEEEVYMNQPLGFIMPGNENKVCKLVRSLYGLKHAPRQWHQNFDEVVLSNGYLLNQADKCVYIKFNAFGKGVIICLYVDDMLIFGNDQVQVDLTKEFLSSRFSMKDTREADVILGIRIKHESNGIAISQSHYIEKVLKKFNYFDCTPVSTPLDTCEKLMPNRGLVVSQLDYSRVIGCLINSEGAEVLEKTINYRLVYSSYRSVLGGYTDASWISNTEDNSSTSGWVFLLSGGVISWASKKQTCITGSTIESEFVALAAAGKEAECAATLAKAYSQMYNEKSRHLGVRHSMIREHIMNGVVSIEFRAEAHVLQIIPKMCLEPAVRRMKLLTSQWIPSEGIPSEEVSSAEYPTAGLFQIEPSAGMLHSELADDSGL
nr:zinc finger, CCHC-type [Tanacetum cinerariifolium]